MREAWTETTLGEACLIKPPKSEAREMLSHNDLVSFVPMSNLGIGTKLIDLDEDRPLGKVVGNYTYFAENDVLLAKITPCFENGKLGVASGLTNGIGFGSSEFVVFRPLGGLSSRYLYYFLSQDSFRVAGTRVMSGAVGHKRVPKDFIDNHPIPLPPLGEQKRIVAILDEEFAGIATAVANTERNLANSRELFEAVLDAAITPEDNDWRTQELQQDIKFIDYRGRTPRKTERGLRLITAKNVRMGILRDEPREFVAPESYEDWMTRGIPSKGDVLFTTEAPLGLVAQLDSDAKVVFAQRIITLQPDRQKIDPCLLQYVLRSQKVQKQIHGNATGATAQGIKASLLKKVLVHFPRERTQQVALGKHLSNTESRCQILAVAHRRKINELTELRQSILQKAFAGELTANPDKTPQEAGL